MANEADPQAGAPAGIDQEALANLVNSAVTSQLKRILPKVLETSLESALAPFREQMAPKPTATPDKPIDPVQAQIDDLKKQLNKEREGRAMERRTTREKEAYATLKSELAGKVRPEAIEAAAKVLFHADRLVKVSDSGEPVFVMGDEELPLSEGISTWAKSKDADLFRPAPGYGSKPAQPARKPNAPFNGGSQQQPQITATQSESPAERAARILDAFQE